MMLSRNSFIKRYVKAIRNGNAGIFAGAGLSSPSGFVDWKNLLRPLAEEIRLDVDKETDLLSVAQYYRNEAGTRASINEEILNAFNVEVKENINIQIIARLPISTYWTTNYDQLIERELEKINKRADVKSSSEQLATVIEDRDAVIYKMHGDVNNPAKAVLTKDDYVLYEKERPLFKSLLKADLISKRLLFIGFSFTDPNLDYVLGQIHALIDENVANHYCIFRRVQKDDYQTDEDYGYEKAKQEFRIKDLARFGIQTVLVNEYSEITDILLDIEQAVKRYNVFISGAADDYGDWKKEKAEELAYKIAEVCVGNNLKVTSGFGLGIGSSVINGALAEINRSKYRHIDEHLRLRPFPQGIQNDETRKKEYTQYRKEMIEDTGVAIFMFGNKKDIMNSGKVIDSQGCWEEFEIARNNKDIIIPIGSTGFVAMNILNEIKANIEEYKYLEEYLDLLETEKEIGKIINVIEDIIAKVCIR